MNHWIRVPVKRANPTPLSRDDPRSRWLWSIRRSGPENPRKNAAIFSRLLKKATRSG